MPPFFSIIRLTIPRYSFRISTLHSPQTSPSTIFSKTLCGFPPKNAPEIKRSCQRQPSFLPGLFDNVLYIAFRITVIDGPCLRFFKDSRKSSAEGTESGLSTIAPSSQKTASFEPASRESASLISLGKTIWPLVDIVITWTGIKYSLVRKSYIGFLR